MNVFPLFSQVQLPVYAQFVPALLVGFFFGFVLERAGFGNARVLAAQFYFYNMRVFKVMFTAIVTAGVGMALLAAVGLLDMKLLAFPETFLWPHIIGGLLLGAGFIISGYCPGTSIVAAASGKLDGFVAVLGVMAGSVLFGLLYPAVKGFYLSTARGVMTLDGLLGLPFALVITVIAAAAVLMFIGAEKVEEIFGRKMKEGERPRTGYSRRLLYAVPAIGVAAVVAAAVIPAPTPARPPRSVGKLTPVQLGQMIIDDPQGLYLVDMRKKPDCEGKDRIPGAACFKDMKESIPDLSPQRKLVYYAYEDLKRTPDRLERFPGEVFKLSGGLRSWKTWIIENPEERAGEIVKTQGRETYSLLSAMHAYFTGAKIAAQAPAGPVRVIDRPKKKGGGCI